MYKRSGIFALLVLVGLAVFTTVENNVVEAQQIPTVASPTPPIEEDEKVEKVETESVNVLFTAQDRNRKLILTLKPEDIRILENGQVQTVSTFSRQVDLPLSLAILIDTSASQERTLPEEKSAAISFLEAVIRPTKDEVSVISFTGESTLEQGM